MTQSIQALAEDVTPPTVILFNPGNTSTNVPINTVIYAEFSEPVDPTTVNDNTFKLFRFVIEDTVPVTGTLTVRPDGIRATFTPTPDPTLGTNTFYTAKINTNCNPDVEESLCIKDLAGNAMQTGYPYTFTTGTELAAEITMTLDPALPKWGQPFTANVHVTGAGEGDTISIDWGDGTTPDENIPVPSSGDATATHVYSKDAASPPTVQQRLL